MIHRAAALSALAAVLAGCAPTHGSGASGPTPTPSGSSTRIAAVYMELVRCIRAHGIPNFPDPVINPQTGQPDLPSGTQKPGPSVMRACQSIADRLPPSGKERTVTAAELAKLRQFAGCMRQHGLNDWPDPDARGVFPLPKRLLDLGKKGIRSQLEACKQYFPSKGISIKRPADSNG
jgi:hypothetical protein